MKMKFSFTSKAAACAAIVATAACSARGDIVYSGVVNINVPTMTDGVYLNVETGVNNPTGGLVPGWDVNPFGAGSTALGYGSPVGFSDAYVAATGSTLNVANLPAGTLISAASTFDGSLGQTTGAQPHAVNSSNNLIGFRFIAADGLVHYGWFRMSFSSTLGGQPRAIIGYAYESVAGVGIQAGATPAPGALALLGLAGLLGARRRRI